ncbi:MAG: sigma-70 family RNA polymerase sigma factor, partial [Kiritimatiellales bacterium]
MASEKKDIKYNKTARKPLYVMKNADKEKNRMDEEDAQILAAYRSGDAEALGELVEKYKRPLFGFILRFSGGRDEADEIFQEVWVRAIKNMNSYRHKSLLSWLFRIAHNLMIDRARRRKPVLSLDTSANEDGIPLGEQIAA